MELLSKDPRAEARSPQVIAITGASGFLGNYVVAEALRRGYQVRAMVRPTTDATRLPWASNASVTIAPVDLRQPASILAALQGVDAVIHLVAAKDGDYAAQYASTVTATENLLRAMAEANVHRLIGISTFSVFDYQAMQNGETVTESSPIEQNPAQRDIYAQTKLRQEAVFRDFGQTPASQVTILRPGMVYGRDNLWNASLGAKKGDRLWLRIGANAQIPLTYVENCAAAIVAAVKCPASIGQTLNIVDDNLPTQTLYADKLLARMAVRPKVVLVSWGVMNLLAQTAWLVNRLLFRGKAKLPGILIPARLHARFKPLRYSNNHAKQILPWTPIYTLDAALDRSLSNTDLFSLPPQPTLTPSVELKS